jgi:hypothetical protein
LPLTIVDGISRTNDRRFHRQEAGSANREELRGQARKERTWGALIRKFNLEVE